MTTELWADMERRTNQGSDDFAEQERLRCRVALLTKWVRNLEV